MALENSESAADGTIEELIGDGVEGARLALVDAEALPEDLAATLVPKEREENLVDGVASGALPANHEGAKEGPSPSTPPPPASVDESAIIPLAPFDVVQK